MNTTDNKPESVALELPANVYSFVARHAENAGLSVAGFIERHLADMMDFYETEHAGTVPTIPIAALLERAANNGR